MIQGAQILRGDVAFPELFGPLQNMALKVSRSVDDRPATGSCVNSGHAAVVRGTLLFFLIPGG